MTYIIGTSQEVNPSTLGDAVLCALQDLNRDRGTDFRTRQIEPTLVKTTRDFDEFVVGKFEYDFDKNGFGRTWDSVLAYRVKHIIGMDKNLRQKLFFEGMTPEWVVIPGLSDTYPDPSIKRGDFYKNPTNEHKFNAFLVGKSIRKISGVNRVLYCWLNSRGEYKLTPVQ
jgi:hypothetical protein